MSAFLIGVGLVIMFFGALGTIILPDLFLRLHASTKCGVTGTVTILLGLIFRCGAPGMAARLLLIIVFIFWTAPLIPHTLGVGYLQERQPPPEAP